ncbi:unnamed protein product [Darwinula stevensoni]|uniref:TAR DNA-binding protein 43 n=1 Tax=Darwinula stevensoni TaxID=69355 RepID=A0A7R8XG25_9CRUS|nr:unnamed protein product [Darwinula stevensoni]CAG0891076.1 unnamed protein product [Darwinula stevensoni]
MIVENKRKSDDLLESSLSKTKRIDKQKCSDLIVLGLPWKTTESELRQYFEGYGEVLMAQVKKDPKTGNSKGFGFIRFATYDAQTRVLSQRHMIDGRWCDVKIPNSKDSVHQAQVPCKVFVGRCTEDMTAEDLREYFAKFGEVTDVFIPKPFRAFAFVTFADPEMAQSLCGEDHIIKGISVHVSSAAPKTDPSRGPWGRGPGRVDLGIRGGQWAATPGANHGGRGDLPNLAALGNSLAGLSGGGPGPASQPGAGGSNPGGMGMGPLNLTGLPPSMSSAIAAAVLNQAGWGLFSNLGGQGGGGPSGDQGYQGYGSYGPPSGGGYQNQPPPPQSHSHGGGGGFMGWGGGATGDAPPPSHGGPSWTQAQPRPAPKPDAPAFRAYDM